MKLTDILTYTAPLNRHGMFSHWTVRIGDHTSVAPSKEQAEQEAVRTLKTALTGSYLPTFVVKENLYGLCWRETNGWWYCIAQIGVPPNKTGWTGVYENGEECEAAMRAHLEQY